MNTDAPETELITSDIKSMGNILVYDNKSYAIPFVKASDQKPYIAFFNTDNSAMGTQVKISETADA